MNSVSMYFKIQNFLHKKNHFLNFIEFSCLFFHTAQWDEAALNVRDLKQRQNNGKQELRRRGSLYDEIPISVQSMVSSSQIRF